MHNSDWPVKSHRNQPFFQVRLQAFCTPSCALSIALFLPNDGKKH